MRFRGDDMMAGFLLGGLIAGVVCGMAPLLAALRLGRVVTGFVCFFLCVGAGLLGGLCLGIPTAFILSGLVSMLGSARSVYPTVDPYSAPSRRREEREDWHPAEPYMRLGQTIVCNECRTASPVDASGRPHARCPGCGVPFREDDAPAVRRPRRDDDVIDLKPAGRD